MVELELFQEDSKLTRRLGCSYYEVEKSQKTEEWSYHEKTSKLTCGFKKAQKKDFKTSSVLLFQSWCLLCMY